ncbi:MAG: carbohydrate ABC transporter permease [Fimbriimonadaceae bacterium]
MRRLSRATILVVVIIAVLVPVLWVVESSFKESSEVFTNPWGLPKAIQWGNYRGAWKEEGLGQGFVNSAIICAATLTILLPIGTMAAYILGRYPFRGSRPLLGVFMGGMMFPNFLLVISLLTLLTSMGLNDSILGVVVAYVAYSLSFTIFVLTGFFESLPKELAEAATIDGCGHFDIFRRVMLPLVRPGIIVVAIFNAIGLWNEYPLALILLSSPEKRTLPLKIADMATNQQYSSNWGHLFAGLVLVMLPVTIVYWLLREKIQEAMVAGAIKG